MIFLSNSNLIHSDPSSCPKKEQIFRDGGLFSRSASPMIRIIQIQRLGHLKETLVSRSFLPEMQCFKPKKFRLTDYLDERSAYLTQFAEEANPEIDQIGENALRELEEAGARVC